MLSVAPSALKLPMKAIHSTGEFESCETCISEILTPGGLLVSYHFSGVIRDLRRF